jgi:hypothetical protein
MLDSFFSDEEVSSSALKALAVESAAISSSCTTAAVMLVTPLILLALAISFGLSLTNFAGKMYVSKIEKISPDMTAAILPATALRISPVELTVSSPLRSFVTTSQVEMPKENPIQGATDAAIVDILDHIKINPIGRAPPPTMTPRMVRIQVRSIETRFKIQQNLSDCQEC